MYHYYFSLAFTKLYNSFQFFQLPHMIRCHLNNQAIDGFDTSYYTIDSLIVFSIVHNIQESCSKITFGKILLIFTRRWTTKVFFIFHFLANHGKYSAPSIQTQYSVGSSRSLLLLLLHLSTYEHLFFYFLYINIQCKHIPLLVVF